MVHDIETMKSLGFTMLRKHAKIEPLRWYAHCDRLGMLVWQDIVNGGGQLPRPHHEAPVPAPDLGPATGCTGCSAARTRPAARSSAARSARPSTCCATSSSRGGVDTVQRGLGPVRRQRDRAPRSPTSTRRARSTTSAAGSTRAAATSAAFHCLPAPVQDAAASTVGATLAARPAGGRAHRVRRLQPARRGPRLELRASSATATSTTPSRLGRGFVELHEPLADAVRRGLGATVYTQLSDVEDELNGLLTWDRDVLKLDADVVRQVTARLHRVTLPPSPRPRPGGPRGSRPRRGPARDGAVLRTAP